MINVYKLKLEKLREQFNQKKCDDEHQALQTYVTRWQDQRDYILQREKAKIAEELENHEDRERSKRERDRQKQTEKEQVQLRKQQEADAIKQAEEERWAPRPFKP